MNRIALVFMLACLLSFLFCTKVAIAAFERPNIVLILADDLGYGDVQCYNPERGRIATPEIDRLAQQGMRFVDAHSSSGVCSPSRYTLLTGRYHWRSRLQSGIVGYLERPLIAEDRLTLAGMLRQQGYRTACIGKWHLGWDWNISTEQRKLFAPGGGKFPPVTEAHRTAWKKRFERPIQGGPTRRGFDEYFGTDVPNWPPYCFIENEQTVGIPSTFLPKDNFKKNLASLPGPALENWDLKKVLPALGERAKDFLQRQSESDQPFFLYLPLTSPHTPLAVNESWQGRSKLDSAVADLVMETDAIVGELLQALDEHGLSDSTIVLFTSDNGFAPYTGAKHLEKQGHFPSGSFRGYKGDAWEGGHRVPFLVRWPGVVPAGTVSEELVHHADVMATVADLLQVSLSDSTAEDSFSFLPLLKGETGAIRPHAISQGAQGLHALRVGQWKLIFGPKGGGPWSNLSTKPNDGQPGQLYDLTADPGEQNNLYGEQETRVQQMTRLMEELVNNGRSNPGSSQKNDVPVKWRRFLKVSE